MNAELLGLLKEAGYSGADDADLDSRVVVVHNQGSVPRPKDLPADFAQSGFKLLLLGRNGRPTHFARCGSVDDRALEREGRLLEVLCRSPRLARMVPATTGVTSGAIRVLLTAFIPGRLYDDYVHTQGPGAWARDVADIMSVRWTISDEASRILPQLLGGGATVRPVEEAHSRLAVLRNAGIEARDLRVLEDTLAKGGELPRVLQHGDLWPGNVIRHQGSWWLIDFAEFAEVQVPMYDVFHMLQSNPGRQSARTQHAWLTLGPGALDDRWSEAARTIVHRHAAQRGYTPFQVGAALVYYLVHLSAYRLRDGVPREYSEAYVRELLRVATELRQGSPAERLAGY